MYDLVIVGAGPAGLTAGIYAMRARLSTLMLERSQPGGEVLLSPVVENYPGIPSISGAELAQRMREHAEGLGLKIELEKVEGVKSEDGVFIVQTSSREVATRSVIIATGERPKPLGVPGESEFRGRGVSYCATCDGFFFADRNVLVVGGGNSALTAAIYLSGIARKVYIAHRRDRFRGERIYHERVLSKPNVEVLWNTVVESIEGKDAVERVVLKDTITGSTRELYVDGVFIYVGNVPLTDMAECAKDENGYIITDERMHTSVEGMFAAGDCRAKRLRQITTAVADGAIAAMEAGEYLEFRGSGREPPPLS